MCHGGFCTEHLSSARLDNVLHCSRCDFLYQHRSPPPALASSAKRSYHDDYAAPVPHNHGKLDPWVCIVDRKEATNLHFRWCVVLQLVFAPPSFPPLVIKQSLPRTNRKQPKWNCGRPQVRRSETSSEAFRDSTVPYLIRPLRASWKQPCPPQG